MKRLLIMTIGKTHSGKTSFGQQLEQRLHNSFVIDQDNNAVFLNTNYKKLMTETGENKLKIGLSQYILRHAIEETDYHIIISSANLSAHGRKKLLETFFPQTEWTRIFVYFNYKEATLQGRIAQSTRSTNIFRNANFTFEELLIKHSKQLEPPTIEEADFIYYVNELRKPDDIILQIIKEATSCLNR